MKIWISLSMEERGFVSQVNSFLQIIWIEEVLHFIFFLVEGCGSVHLTGNLLNDGRDMLDMEDGDDNMEIMDEIEEENGITEEINGNNRTKSNKKNKKKKDMSVNDEKQDKSKMNGKADSKDLKHKENPALSKKMKKKNGACKQKWVKGREKKLFDFE